jgi:hypothetical protein
MMPAVLIRESIPCADALLSAAAIACVAPGGVELAGCACAPALSAAATPDTNRNVHAIRRNNLITGSPATNPSTKRGLYEWIAGRL